MTDLGTNHVSAQLDELPARQAAALDRIIDTCRWLHVDGYGEHTDRRPGEPGGRSTSSFLGDDHRDGPATRDDFAPGAPARSALDRTRRGLRNADQHLCHAGNLLGSEWRPVGPADVLDEIVTLAGAIRQSTDKIVGVMTASNLNIPIVARQKVATQLLDADAAIHACDTFLAHRFERPETEGASCANPACPDPPATGRKECAPCARYRLRHHGELRPIGDHADAYAARDRRRARGEGWGAA